MTSEPSYSEAFVWIWLPGADTPVVAGRLFRRGRSLAFNYGRSYLARADAIALYLPELPLKAGAQMPQPGLEMPGCIRDAAPDAWGRRVLINRRLGLKGVDAAGVELDELAFLLESGSDRVGALDFQTSPERYIAREKSAATLDDLQRAADQIERGVPLAPDLALALQHGTSLGGARPKAQLDDANHKYIAKFSAGSDTYNVVKAEFVAMRLARLAGLDVASVRLARAMGKDVLLIERFDRAQVEGHWRRKSVVSALTILELDEMLAPYASYQKLAEIIRHRFSKSTPMVHELFGRMVFNILCGNTDDHARNHAAFWDGHSLALTPAYDICPQARTGQEASQAMLIVDGDRRSQIAACIAAAPEFLLSARKAVAIVNGQIGVIMRSWDAVCDEAELPDVERRFLWRRQFLNPYAFYDAPAAIRGPAD